MLTTYYFARRKYTIDMPFLPNESICLIESMEDLLKDLVMLSHKKQNPIELKQYEVFSVDIEDTESNYIFFEDNGHTYHIRRIAERERMTVKNLGFADDLCKQVGIKTRRSTTKEDQNA